MTGLAVWGSLAADLPAIQHFTFCISLTNPAAATTVVCVCSCFAPCSTVPVAKDRSADAASELLAKMRSLSLEQQHNNTIRQLLQAARSGGALLQCVAGPGAAGDDGGVGGGGGGAGGADVQQQQKKPSSAAVVDFLMKNDVRDEFGRNLLHLVATHSL